MPGVAVGKRNDLHWDFDGYVWNNDGDKATLRKGDGTVVDRCAYSSGTYVVC